MGTAYYYNDYASEYNHDLTIAKGVSTIRFNPGGDPSGSEVEEVRFKFHIDHNGGQAVDLGDVDIWMVSPNGETNRIYYNFDGFGKDTDDGNDSDSADDYDISFSGTDLKSSIKFGFDGNGVNGNWGLKIQNDTGITLDLNYLEVWVDYKTAPDLEVKDIQLSGVGGNEVGTPMLIETWIENTGDQRYGSKIELEYLVNGEVIGTSELTFGLNGGSTNFESELHTFDQYGDNDVSVRIVGANDIDTSNNSLTKTFNFSQPDLVVSDVRVLGDWGAGETIEIRPFIENIGTDAWNLLKGSIKVEYTINGDVVGDDSVSFGLTPLFGDWESFDYTLTSDDPVTIGVRVYGNDVELTNANNSWKEEYGHDHDTGAQKTVANSAFDVKMASFLVHTIYGVDALPENGDNGTRDDGSGHANVQGSNDNGLQDDYRGYLAEAGWTVLDDGDLGQYYRPNAGKAYFADGGLFVGDAQDINIFTSFGSQGLLATGTSPTGEKTLTLTFRGTDGDDSFDAALGQAFTGNGIYNYYEAMRPLIDAAIAYANDASNGIDKMIVSGHSLGGATADLFTLVDAHRLVSDIDLSVVSIASAGLHPKALLEDYKKNGMLGQFDERLVEITGLGTSDEAITLKAPSYYIGASFSNDTVTFDRENPTSLPLIPNFTLNTNENFDDGLIAIDLPNVSAADPTASGTLESQLGFGAEHNHGLYWAILGMIADDALVTQFDGHQIIAGETNYADIGTLAGDPLGVFAEFAGAKSSGYENDHGATALVGDTGDDYILGLGGDDMLVGGGGSNLLSGGAGDDTLKGGAGADRMDGGEGYDIADYSGLDARVKVHLMQLEKNLGEAIGDTYASIEHWLGTSFNDIMVANSAINTLSGGDGNDNLNGLGGRDRLYGGTGNDKLNGGKGRDRLEGEAGNDSVLGGAGADKLYGGTGDDTLNGGSGDDAIFGGQGLDVLIGGKGNDTMRGNGNSDTFIFADGHGADIITDFKANDDNEKIDLRKVSALGSTGDITDLNGAGSQQGSDVLIDTGGGNSILLMNTQLVDLDAADFIF